MFCMRPLRIRFGPRPPCVSTTPTTVPAARAVRPGSSSRCPAAASWATRVPLQSPYAVVAKLAGLIDNPPYARGHAPRVLAGKVLAHTGIASVSLRLRRSYRGRCLLLPTERVPAFGPAQLRWMGSSSGRPQGELLLPAAQSLPPGATFLDAEATDAAGNRTTLARDSRRVLCPVGAMSASSGGDVLGGRSSDAPARSQRVRWRSTVAVSVLALSGFGLGRDPRRAPCT